MRTALSRPGQCAFCAFRAAQRLPPPPQCQDGARRHRITVSYRPLGKRSPDGKSFGHRPDRYNGQASSSEILLAPGNHVKREESAYEAFGELLESELGNLKIRLSRGPMTRFTAWGITSRRHLADELESFRTSVRFAVEQASRRRIISQDANPLFHDLRKAFISGHLHALAAQLDFRFMTSVLETKNLTNDTTSGLQKQLADFRFPIEWYPATRALQRTIHLHVGPTNSGKTYHALKKLETAKTGIYAGPLRLLAHEVYTRFNAMGKKCALITGEERRIPEGLDTVFSSCTVEMIPLNTLVDVAVIDEIQMLGDTDRGWAWTQAFLGIMAKEVHLCGELRTVSLIRDLCAAMGDKLIIHKYERLSPLKSEHRSLNGDLSKLEKGDAVILFSRIAIHAMKASIEKTTGKRCAIVYGSLPPETRAQQAALFNDPNNDYDILVASNAVGMGLNLSIRRVVFETLQKHNGQTRAPLQVPEINQIAGRAGRFKSAHEATKQGATEPGTPGSSSEPVKSQPNVGYVTTIDGFDLPIVQKAMTTVVEPLKSAGILPPADAVVRFAALFPSKTPFSYILLRLHELAILNPQYHMCRLKEQVEIADLIQPYSMTITDRLAFMSAPITLRDAGFPQVVAELAQCITNQTGGELLDLKSFPLELLDQNIHDHAEGSKGYLRTAEMLHKALTLYLWLSYRFAGVYRSQALAFHVKGLLEEKIDECLASVKFDGARRRRENLSRYHTMKREQEEMREKIEGVEDLANESTWGKELDGELETPHDLAEYPASDSNILIPAAWQEGKFDDVITSTSESRL
ncbi:ATP-dependent RNA helicase, mitochondrial [Lachnellula occidentalis]|uniref:RNA helicase n=1 Tax=Lachnellula occidentalis TaxID=215460 RepID=A0A8H8S498_9HELO|nr:ATP-dependent RNA helicase, mitochondrial [Lachnellula occidentalis]